MKKKMEVEMNDLKKKISERDLNIEYLDKQVNELKKRYDEGIL